MVSKTWNAMLVAATASAITTMAVAETPATDSPLGISAKSYRMIAISKYGLDNPALRLTPAQQAEIDRIIDAHAVRQIAVNKQYPLPKDGTRPTEAEIQARQAITSSATAALGQVMQGEQKKIWEAQQAARESAANAARKPAGSAAPKR